VCKSVLGPQEQVLQYLWGPSTNLRSDFCIENVFDPIFREKLTGGSILQWARAMENMNVGGDVVDMDLEEKMADDTR